MADFTVRDYVGGMKDLKDGVIRLIGNPETRYREDPVRMLRAVRFAAHFCGLHQITPYLAVTIWRGIRDVLSNNFRVGKLYLSRQRII